MSASRTLRERVAGQSAMCDVVRAQRNAPARSVLARILGRSPLTPEGRVAYSGALGELLVGDLLENLGPTWDVLHDLPLGDMLLDHLVIGPAGVFTVHVTNANDADVVVDGDTMYIQAKANEEIPLAAIEAEIAQRVLTEALGRTVRVKALLVVVEPRRLSVRTPSESVRVIPSYQLEKVLGRAPRTLNGAAVAAISDCADLPSTWPAWSGASLDTAALHRQFALVRAEVRGALLRRILWGTAGIASLYCTVWALVASFVSLVVGI